MTRGLRVIIDSGGVRWTTSSFCDTDGCVAVGRLADGTVAIGDTKDLSRPALIFTSTEWNAFVAGVRAGEFSS